MKPMNDQAKKVLSIMETRMSKTSTIVLGIVCLVLFFISFLPLLFNNMSTKQSTKAAINMILVMLLVIGILMIVALLILRIPLVTSVRDFNNETTETLNKIKRTMSTYSKYLSSICNVRRGNAVLTYCEKHPDVYTTGIRIRKKHEEDIRKKRAQLLENYSDYILGKEYYDETMMQPYDYDFSMKMEYDYPAPFMAGDFRQVDFLMSGNLVQVPSSYVKRITLKMEDVYDE